MILLSFTEQTLLTVKDRVLIKPLAASNKIVVTSELLMKVQASSRHITLSSSLQSLRSHQSASERVNHNMLCTRFHIQLIKLFLAGHLPNMLCNSRLQLLQHDKAIVQPQ